MKKIFVLICALFFYSVSVFAQATEFELKKDEGTGDAYYEEVVQIANMKQADIYQRAKTWILANFKTSDNNIGFDDKEFSIVNAAALKIDKKKQ